MSKTRIVELFKDTKFNHRMALKGFDSRITGQTFLGEMRWNGSKSGYNWSIAEWASKHLLKDEMNEIALPDGGIDFCNESKSVKLYPGQGKISLFSKCTSEYSGPRQSHESWVHLLLEQAIYKHEQIRLEKVKHLYLELEFCVSKCDMHMTAEEYDPGVHAAQVSWYFTVENTAGTKIDFEGRPDYYWFGLPLYDNRHKRMIGPQVAYDGGTEKLIYAMNRGDYVRGEVELGKTYSFKIDVINDLRHAFELTQRRGWLRGAKWEDMAIGSTNIGWEIPGTFDAEFVINNINVVAEYEEDEE